MLGEVNGINKKSMSRFQMTVSNSTVLRPRPTNCILMERENFQVIFHDH